MFICTKLRLKRCGPLLFIGIIVAASLSQVGYAAPQIPDAKHLETLDSARLLRFTEGAWWSGVMRIFDASPIVVPESANKRAYTVIEVTATNVSSSSEIRLIDSDSSVVLDTLQIPNGTQENVL